MKILALGDVVGVRAIDYLSKNLWGVRKNLGVDFVIANAENASEIHGLCPRDADRLLDAGVDFMTMGNHTFGKREIYSYLDDNPERIIRPCNYPPTAPGYGSYTINVNGYKMLCINVQGTVFMEPLDSPFDAVDCILGAEEGKYDFAFLDIHAEATSEKIALARYFDGRINMIVGTHTHVQTADNQILPNGTGYITDLGMTGPVSGVLGVDTEATTVRLKDHLPARFTVADGEIKAHGVVFELDDSFKAVKVTRVKF